MNKSLLFKLAALPLFLLGLYIPIELWNATAGNLPIIGMVLKNGYAAVTLETLISVSIYVFIVLNPGYMMPGSTRQDQYYLFFTEAMNVISLLMWTSVITHPDPDVAWISMVIFITFAMLMNVSGIIRFLIKK